MWQSWRAELLDNCYVPDTALHVLYILTHNPCGNFQQRPYYYYLLWPFSNEYYNNYFRSEESNNEMWNN